MGLRKPRIIITGKISHAFAKIPVHSPLASELNVQRYTWCWAFQCTVACLIMRTSWENLSEWGTNHSCHSFNSTQPTTQFSICSIELEDHYDRDKASAIFYRFGQADPRWKSTFAHQVRSTVKKIGNGDNHYDDLVPSLVYAMHHSMHSFLYMRLMWAHCTMWMQALTYEVREHALFQFLLHE